MRLFQALKHDMRYQFRHGFYFAYLVVLGAYLVALLNVPSQYRNLVVSLVVFSDTSVLGFFFVGAILLLEREEGTLRAVSVTPLRPTEFCLSKALSLTVLALVVSGLMSFAHLPAGSSSLFYYLGVLGSSLFYTFIGIGVASQAQSLNGYFFRGTGYTVAFMLPLLDFFGLVESPLFWLLPTLPTLTLLQSAYREPGLPLLAVSALVLSVWVILALFFGLSAFRRHIIFQGARPE